MELTVLQGVSSILGWTYMLCWSASFYPQPILNFQRKTTLGFSIDFALLNILGMTCYAIYSLALFSNPIVRQQYAHRYPHHPSPTVQLNDVVYSLHGAITTTIIYSQFYTRLWRFTPINGLKCSHWSLFLFWGCIGAVFVAVLAVLSGDASLHWLWLDVVSDLQLNFIELLTQ